MSIDLIMDKDLSMAIRIVTQLAKENGLKRLRVGEIEIELGESKSSTVRTGSVVPVDSVITNEEEEDDLFYSVGG